MEGRFLPAAQIFVGNTSGGSMTYDCDDLQQPAADLGADGCFVELFLPIGDVPLG